MEFELNPEYTVDDFDDYWRGFRWKAAGKRPPRQGSPESRRIAGGILLFCGAAMAGLSIWASGFSNPLSIGMGVLFAAAGLLAVVRGVPEHSRWAQKAWENYVKQGLSYTYRFGEDGFEIHLGVSDHRFDYALVQQIWEDDRHFYLLLDAKACHILNKNSFDKGDPAQFAAFLAQKTGKSVRWVDGEDQRPFFPA